MSIGTKLMWKNTNVFHSFEKNLFVYRIMVIISISFRTITHQHILPIDWLCKAEQPGLRVNIRSANEKRNM